MNDYRYQQRRITTAESAGTPVRLPADAVPAMLYVPWQTDISAYDEMKALEAGTLFVALNKPFAGKRCK